MALPETVQHGPFINRTLHAFLTKHNQRRATILKRRLHAGHSSTRPKQIIGTPDTNERPARQSSSRVVLLGKGAAVIIKTVLSSYSY